MANVRCRFLGILFLALIASAQISKPIATDDAVDIENNKFLQRRPELDLRARTA